MKDFIKILYTVFLMQSLIACCMGAFLLTKEIKGADMAEAHVTEHSKVENTETTNKTGEVDKDTKKPADIAKVPDAPVILSTESESVESSKNASSLANTTASPRPNCPDGIEFLSAPKCDQYYQCYAGEGYLHSCPPGLYWSPELNVCDWSDALCDERKGSFEPTAVPGTTCANGAIFLPDRSNCHQYIQCAYGREFVLSCPHGLYWQQTSMRCDYSREACK